MGLRERAKATFIDLRATGRILKEAKRMNPRGHWNTAKLVATNADRLPTKPALLYGDERYTWEEVNARSNQYADFFRKQGIRAGDAVALVMDNRPDYIFIQTGLSKLRAVTAFINNNLTGPALAHAINVASPTAVIAGSEHLAAVRDVVGDLKLTDSANNLWAVLESPNQNADGARVIDEAVSISSSAECAVEPETLDPMCYIYTSGTTGLPKAAVIKNQRYLMAATLFGRALHESGPGDVIYVTLPLYHSNAQWGGWAACALTGATMALRRKFSATNFWADVNRYNATHFIYIGEVCRYLLNQQPVKGERGHRLRLGVGNGLRPDIWEEFQRRFGIPLMREFYGATEGNAPMVNIAGRPGMVGRLRPGQAIVRCDLSTGELKRNAAGRAERVQEGQTGLLIGKITAITKFDGYADESATQKKILRDVFKPGDAYFNSGDLLTLHDTQWVAFADRVGDTFRWKGENVSTNEVAEALNGAQGVLEANVYGVQVPHTDGRAGMASLNIDDSFDLEDFAAYVFEKLPNFQRPYFVRLQRNMRITGTFKHQKVDYRKEGFDPALVEDPLYFLGADKKYRPIDAELFAQLQSGEIAP